MSEGSQVVKLGEVLTQVRRPVLTAGQSSVPFAGVRWYGSGVYKRDEAETKEVKTSTLNRLSIEDITYNRMWATKAAFGVVDSEAEGCLVTNDFPIFRCNEDVLLPQFMSLVFHLPSFQHAAAELATGTTERRRLKEDAFLSISILLPSLDMQRRLIDLIRAVDDTIKAAHEEGRRAGTCLQVICDELSRTTDTAVPLRSLGSTVTGRTPATAVERYWFEPTVNFFTPADLGNALEVTNASRKVSAAGAEEVRWLPNYSVVQVCIGATLGKVSMLPLGGTANQQINALTGLPELDSVALALLLRSGLMQSNVVGASGKTTLPIISKSSWSSMSVPWPPPEQRKHYALLGRAVEATRCNAREVVESLSTLRSALLSELLLGERTIPVSYDKLLSD